MPMFFEIINSRLIANNGPEKKNWTTRLNIIIYPNTNAN